MTPLLIVRPEPGASATLAAARALGLDTHAYPIFAVNPVPWKPITRSDVDAVVLGSANAIRHAGPEISELRGLPAYCVGKSTAEAANAAGLKVVQIGSGGLQNVLARLAPTHRRLLRLAGVTHLDLTLPDGVSMTTREVYASAPVPASIGLLETLKKPNVVMLHSGEAAAHLGSICRNPAVDTSQISLAVIGQRVAQIAIDASKTPWSAVAIAASPSDAALLALAHEMCKEASGERQKPQ